MECFHISPLFQNPFRLLQGLLLRPIRIVNAIASGYPFDDAFLLNDVKVAQLEKWLNGQQDHDSPSAARACGGTRTHRFVVCDAASHAVECAQGGQNLPILAVGLKMGEGWVMIGDRVDDAQTTVAPYAKVEHVGPGAVALHIARAPQRNTGQQLEQGLADHFEQYVLQPAFQLAEPVHAIACIDLIAQIE
jgi:hypothetical protein